MSDFLQDNLRVFVVPVEIMDVPDLDIYEQMVYIVLRSFTNPRESTAFPSYNTIAKLSRMSRRKAIDSVSSLTEKGLIQKEIRLDVTSNRKIRNKSNIYTINSPKGGAQRAPGGVHSAHPGGAQRAPGGVHSAHPGGAQRAPEHNHLTNPLRTKPINNNKEDTVVANIQNTIKGLLQNINLEINDKVITRWMSLDQEENIVLAIQDVLKRRDIKNPIGYITRTLEMGYTPTRRQKVGEFVPTYPEGDNLKQATLTYAQRKEALDLLLELEEIDQLEYKKRLDELN